MHVIVNNALQILTLSERLNDHYPGIIPHK